MTAVGTLDGAILRYGRVEITVQVVTPACAAVWLEANVGNRRQRRRAVEAYASDMRQGDWPFIGDPVRFDWDGHLIDGQHRLEAIIESGVSVPLLVIRHLPPDAREVIDTGRARSAADALTFAGINVQSRDVAAVARIALAADAGEIVTSADVGNGSSPSHREIIRWTDRNPDVALAVTFASSIAQRLRATRSAVGYAFLVLSRIDTDAAVEFFDSAANAKTSGRGDPRLAMLDGLRALRNKTKSPRPAPQLLIIFDAWNAWRRGKSLQIIRTTYAATDGTRPRRIPEPVA